ncbi:MAG: esterase, partial [Flavobacterium sp.]
MTNGFRNLFILALIICSHQLVKAQGNQNQQYLQKIGVLDSLFSDILNETRKVYIQVPDGYNAEKDQKYPVAFILDGETFLPTVNDVQKYYSGGFTPEMILVGIANDKNRVRDLTTSTI